MKPALHIALVNPPGDLLLNEHVEPPLGLISIASFLEQHVSIRPTVLDLTGCSLAEASGRLAACPADVYGFTVFSTKWHIVQTLAAAARTANPASIIVFGGPHPTALPDETSGCPNVNVVVTGEGEVAFADLVRGVMASHVNSRTRAVIRGRRLRQEDFPVIDFSYVEHQESYERRAFGHPMVTLEASRGCPYICFYCNSVVMGGPAPGGIVSKAPAAVIKEITDCLRRGYNSFRFNDDTFVQAARQSGLLEGLRGLGARYRLFANASHLTADAVRDLAQSGCFHISVGVESYDPENLALIGKNNQQEIRDGIERAHNAGVVVRAYFLVGLPQDSRDSITNYMELAAQDVAFDEFTVYPVIPYPGTALWHSPERFGYTIVDRDFTKYAQIDKHHRGATVLRHARFGPDDVAAWIDLANNVFMQHGKTPSFRSVVT